MGENIGKNRTNILSHKYNGKFSGHAKTLEAHALKTDQKE